MHFIRRLWSWFSAVDTGNVVVPGQVFRADHLCRPIWCNQCCVSSVVFAFGFAPDH
jgi:hypothetical protein